MFDFAWTEIALIGVVALIAIGPKDMPVAIKAVSEMIKKARRMASEFQVHVDEMVREANLHEVKDHIRDIRNLDIKGRILNAVDGDGALRNTMNTPLVTPYVSPMTPLPEPVVVGAAEPHVITNPDDAPAQIPPAVTLGRIEAPAFIPPAIAHAPEAPAFIPPAAARETKAGAYS